MIIYYAFLTRVASPDLQTASTLRDMTLAPDATHRAGRRHEVRFTDVMAGLLLPNHALKPFADIRVRMSIAQSRTQVVLSDTEEASADFAVGRQSNAIAMAAERLAYRRDDADLAAAIGKFPALRG